MTARDGLQLRNDTGGSRYAYPSSARELLLHATILAAALWAAVFADVVGPGLTGRYSKLPKGNDFLVFYVSGRLAAAGEFDVLVNDREFRQAQKPFLGAASPVAYPAVYPPQIGIAFAPLSRLPYTAAYFTWTALTLLFFGAALLEFVRRASILPHYPWTIVMVALAFPPLAYLVLAGQLSGVALLALAITHRGLSRRSPFLAGAALGLLGCKASLFFPAVAVCLLAGEWVLTVTAIGVAALQTVGVAPVAGFHVVVAGLRNLLTAAHNPDALAMRPYLMVSWRSFWALLVPARWVAVLYPATAAATVVMTAGAWRRTTDPLRRVGLLSVAIVLAAPHLFIYDLVVTVPAFVLATREVVVRRHSRLYVATAAAFVCPLAIPIAAWTHVQVLTLVLAVWWWTLVRSRPAENPLNDALR